MEKDFTKLETILGVIFKNRDLLVQALVHRSYLNENPSFHLNHNERLEFLGDAVLEFVVTEHLYKVYPNPEGELTNWRASIVNANTLSEIAKELTLGDFLYLSRGEAKDQGKARHYILANALEAVLGAIFLDQGTRAVKKIINKFVIPKLPYIIEHDLYRDPKSKFQEIAQEKFTITPNYKVIEEWGPDHAKHFRIGVYLNSELVATGEGSSKQEAEVLAAQNALKAKGW
jgi:ribonuclease-3